MMGGTHNKVTGISAIAAGFYNTASGRSAVALGNNALASDDYSITVGTSSTAARCGSHGSNTLSLCASAGVYINGVLYVAGGGSDPAVATLQTAVAANTANIAANTAAIAVLDGGSAGSDAAAIADLTDQVNTLRAGLIIVSILTVGQLAGLVYVRVCVRACVRACTRVLVCALAPCACPPRLALACSAESTLTRVFFVSSALARRTCVRSLLDA